jgi:TatA/E family protein of Tat protein translocase
MGIENPVHLLFIALVALIVLGPKRLPELARALGKGIREFREAIAQETHEADPPAADVPPAGQALLTAPAPVAEPAQVARAPQVDPAQAVRSGDAPDRGPL